MVDTIRLLRVLEYVGTREEVEKAINNSIHGTKVVNKDLKINAATLGNFPEVLKKDE